MEEDEIMFERYMTLLNIAVPIQYRSGAIRCTREIREAVALLAAIKYPETEPSNGFDPLKIVDCYKACHG
ncbi:MULTISPECIES: hypothetical protein [unclassified Serratia (in: enterobacteria)]|uniref:hypothetical protein n=1 Tax=unclassified Serratia (in: enterobacteria) TaxID=2647522 RepID=UPI002ED60458|nr:hypothetical protein [Serratia sp. C2(2)]MEE4448986.1 hypothetical protein [Serratia sp. C2(1)]